MPDVIACPDPACGAPATIVDRWTFASTGGPLSAHAVLKAASVAPVSFSKSADAQSYAFRKGAVGVCGSLQPGPTRSPFRAAHT